jgi:toxin ParE1/3/4
MIVAFHEDALAEFRAAAIRYARRNPALAIRFIESVEDAIRRIVDTPTTWRIIDDGVRRCLTHVFPYGVLYSIEGQGILILAVAHCSREPGYWKARVSR